MFIAAQNIGVQDPNSDNSLLSYKISKLILEHSVMKFEREGSLKERFNEWSGRLIIKGEGLVEDYKSVNKKYQMNCSPWRDTQRKQASVVIICNILSLVVDSAFKYRSLKLVYLQIQ